MLARKYAWACVTVSLDKSWHSHHLARRLPHSSQGLACPPGVCRGNPATALQLYCATNRDMNFSHVYAPWQCGPYTLYDGPACLAGKRLAFIGNSRTYQLMEYLKDHSSRYDRALRDASNNSSAVQQQAGHASGRHHHHHTRHVTGTGTHGAARSGEGTMASRSPGPGGGSGSSSSSSMPRMHLDKLSHRMGLRQVLAQTNLTQLLLDYDFVIINRWGTVPTGGWPRAVRACSGSELG